MARAPKKTQEVPAIKAADPSAPAIAIAPLNFQILEATIEGTAPYVQNKFSEKARTQIMNTQAEGSTSRGKKKREPKDFEALCDAATYMSEDGWLGQPAASYRKAMISACRTVGFAMTRAKLSIFVEADGYDAEGTGLVRIAGKPKQHTGYVRLPNGGTDIRSRPMWAPGWTVTLRIRFDADMFTAKDVLNLLVRAGAQVGVGEGRADSKESAGNGWGSFKVQ